MAQVLLYLIGKVTMRLLVVKFFAYHNNIMFSRLSLIKWTALFSSQFCHIFILKCKAADRYRSG